MNRNSVVAGLNMVLAVSVALGSVQSVVAAEQDVEIMVDGTIIHGSLLAPDLAPSGACALIIAGSGPTDRDGNTPVLPGNNNSLKYLAQALQSLSIETLRYDKRMVGQSVSPAQTEADLRFTHYVDDAITLYQWLDRRCSAPVFILGHSEGGHIALTAAQQITPAGLVILAGPGVHPAELIASQLAEQISGDLLVRSKAALQQLREGALVSSPPAELAALFRPSVQPYLISWFQYDPVSQMAGVSVPALLIYGTTDLQVPASDGVALAAANPHAVLHVIEGMNHVLKLVDGPMARQMSSYSDPALPLAPELSRVLARFMLSQ